MSTRVVGLGLILGGGLVIAASLLADVIGLGAQPGIIGWKQVLGAIAGLGISVVGIIASARRRNAGNTRASWDPGVSSRQPPDSGRMEPRLEGVQASVVAKHADLPIYDSTALRIPFIHELSELVRYRFLLWNLVLRDLKVRYKRSVLGFFWAMVNPLLTMAVLLVVFARLFRFDVEHYPIYLLAGVLLWTLFARGTSVAMRSVIDSAGIRNKIYVPASVFVAAAVGSALVNLLFAIAPLLLLAILTGVRPNLAWLYLPVPILQTTLFAFGVGVLIAALAVFFADILDIYEVLLGAFFYLTPIFYPVSILPAQLMRLEQLNPMFQFIDGFRAPLLEGRLPDASGILLGTLAALVMTVVGWSLFTRLMDQFAYRA